MNKVKDLISREAEVAETAEADSEISDHDVLPAGTKVTRGHDRSRTLQIRLNGEEWDELERLAKARELPVSTVARGLLLASTARSHSMPDALSRLGTALAEIRRLVAEQPRTRVPSSARSSGFLAGSSTSVSAYDSAAVS